MTSLCSLCIASLNSVINNLGCCCTLTSSSSWYHKCLNCLGKHLVILVLLCHIPDLLFSWCYYFCSQFMHIST
jgi:hypothetical protein